MVVFRSQDLPQTQAAPCGVQAKPHSGCPSACSMPLSCRDLSSGGEAGGEGRNVGTFLGGYGVMSTTMVPRVWFNRPFIPEHNQLGDSPHFKGKSSQLLRTRTLTLPPARSSLSILSTFWLAKIITFPAFAQIKRAAETKTAPELCGMETPMPCSQLPSSSPIAASIPSLPKKQAEKAIKSADLLAGWEKPTLGFVPVDRNLPGTDMPRSEAKCPLPLQWPWLLVRLLQHRASAHPSGTALRRALPKQQKPLKTSSYALFSTGVCRRWHLEQATPTQTPPAPATCSKPRAWRAEVGTSALAGLTSCPLWALMSR